MKNVKTLIKYPIGLLCFLVLASFTTVPGLTDGTDGKKKKKEEARELTYDQVFQDNTLELDFNTTPKIKIYNANDVLVYEDNVACIKEIQPENLRKLFTKCNYVMKNNNIRYYIINQ